MADATVQRPTRKGEEVANRLKLGTQHGELDDSQAGEDARHADRSPQGGAQDALNERPVRR